MIQAWDANQYVNHASFVAKHGSQVLDLLNPKSGERVLDLGCGDGLLTLDIEKCGASVHGVDLSQSMIEIAQKRGLSAEVMNGENLTFNNEFDAVFSNAALHWMTSEESVLRGVSNSLTSNGRFVGEFGGEGNVVALVSAMSSVFASHSEFGEFNNPWYFPSVEEYQQKLQNNGFYVHYIALIPRPTPLCSGIEKWLEIFSNGITKNLNQEQKSKFINEVECLAKPHLYVEGKWVADYVRLRFFAQKV